MVWEFSGVGSGGVVGSGTAVAVGEIGVAVDDISCAGLVPLHETNNCIINSAIIHKAHFFIFCFPSKVWVRKLSQAATN